MINLGKILTRTIGMAAVTFGCFSCLTINNNLGADFLETDQLFDTYTATLPLEDIEMRLTDSLSGYTQRRITIGSIRDSEFGLMKKGCALTLIPFSDSLDFGTNPRDPSFTMTMTRDTFSYYGNGGDSYLQNINIYELTEDISNINDINSYDKIKNEMTGKKKITKGTPVYSCLQTSTTFNFSDDYTKSLLDRLVALDLKGEEKDSIQRYLQSIPGIFIETDDPIGEGGRIDMFDLQMDYNTDSYYLEGNFAQLAFTADYGDRKDVDTSFIFLFGLDQFYDLDSLLYYNSGDFPQYCLNVCHHETRSKCGIADKEIFVEGGGGLKPVVTAKEIRNLLMDEIASHGGDSKAIINKVSIVLPFQFPEDYTQMNYYPTYLSPTCRIYYSSLSNYSYAGITDSSAEDENQGTIDRSNLVYRPDITYHAQSILSLSDTADFSIYDIWLLAFASEEENDNTSIYEEEQNEYYNNLMYASYYNNMYYGGYSGYGYSSYGSGYGYSNYYNYLMMASLYGSSSSSSTSYTTELDRDRFYKAKLYGPGEKDESLRPRIEVTYSIPKVSR